MWCWTGRHQDCQTYWHYWSSQAIRWKRRTYDWRGWNSYNWGLWFNCIWSTWKTSTHSRWRCICFRCKPWSGTSWMDGAHCFTCSSCYRKTFNHSWYRWKVWRWLNSQACWYLKNQPKIDWEYGCWCSTTYCRGPLEITPIPRNHLLWQWSKWCSSCKTQKWKTS